MNPMLALAVALRFISCAAASASPEPVPALILQRSLPLSGTHLERLKEHDRSRLARKRKNGAAAADFYLDGMPGLYYAHVKLGTPSKEYSLQFDTGSDVLWVSCTPCTGCPTSTELNITLAFYDPNSSSTSSKILCSDNRCTYALETGAAVCNPSDSISSQCGYTNTYVDGSATSGYYVSNTLHFDAFMRNEQGVSSSASVFFGCSTSRSGNLHTDGIIGFGKNAMSVISQLKTQGMSPRSILPLPERLKRRPHYSVNMKSIHVNGKEVSIDSSLFTTSNTKGTIVDSGTSLAYLADGIYGPVTRAIKASVVQSVGTFEDMGDDCYMVSRSNSTASLFPTVTLYFEGGAAITLVPKDYLVLRGYYDEDLSSKKMILKRYCASAFKGASQPIITSRPLYSEILFYMIKYLYSTWRRCAWDG